MAAMDQHSTPSSPRPERRGYPRLRLDCPLVLGLAGRDPLHAVAYDLSRAGIQVRCSVDQARSLVALTPGGSGDPAIIEAGITLQFGDRPLRLQGRLRRCHVSRTQRDEVALGFEFLSLTPASRQALQLFIEQALAP